MSTLQLALIAFGVVLVAAVWIYNVVQEKRARGKAEESFGGRPPDALFEESERREPTLGELPEEASRAPRKMRARPDLPAASTGELDTGGAPAAVVSNSRIDTVAVILADDPVMSEQLQPLLDALKAHLAQTHVEGIVDEQWHPIETSPRRSWRELRVGLQLASRFGAVTEDEIERFNRTIADFAAAVNAVSQREAPATAAARARELDTFCADTDVEVVVNVVGQFGATFSIAARENARAREGLAETARGEFVRYGADGEPAFSIRKLDDAKDQRPHYYSGLTFALDLPNVPDAPAVLAEMVGTAELFASTLGGQLVDDNRKPLTEHGIVSIRRSLEKIFHDMEAQGIPAGGALARRLFT